MNAACWRLHHTFASQLRRALRDVDRAGSSCWAAPLPLLFSVFGAAAFFASLNGIPSAHHLGSVIFLVQAVSMNDERSHVGNDAMFMVIA